MRIIVAPDSFKGSLTAKQACEAMAKGIAKVMPSAEIISIPMSDGGEGTIDSLADATGGRIVRASVQDPIGRPIEARYALLGDGITAAIEMAEASGLTLLTEAERNPLVTSTYGTGLLIRHALDEGCRKFILGIGGSATNDGGTGMATALGVKFLDAVGHELEQGGGSLIELADIDVSSLDSRIAECDFQVACDVDNLLCGAQGASSIFGPQKGATSEMVAQLDQGLSLLANAGAGKLGIDIHGLQGGGAGGGMAAGAVLFLGAKLESGIELVKKAARLDEQLSGADLIITGEGRCDSQTVHGKTPFGVAVSAKRAGVPAVIIAGTLGQGIEALYDHGVVSAFSMIDQPMSLEQAIEEADQLLERAAERVVRLWSSSR
jgi:glycerate kinase